MGCLQLSYYEDLSGFTGVSQLKVIYVNPRLRAKKGSDFSGVDYYPFGEKMPGRFDNGNAPTGEGMFGYQGQEKVGNGSKWYNFQLRMYNPSIGRWNTIDPYAQHYSPYLAMSNNPISYIDPDGGRDRKSVDQEHAMSVINARLGLSSYLRFYGAESVDDKIVLSILGITHGTGGGGAGGGGGGLSANAYGPNSGLDSWQDNVFGTMAFNESEDGTRSLTLAEAAGIVNRLDAVGLGGLYAGGGLKDAQDNFDRAKRQAKRQADLVANNGSIDIEEFVVTEIGIDHTAAISKHIREYLNSKSDYHGPVPSLSQGLGSDVKGGGGDFSRAGAVLTVGGGLLGAAENTVVNGNSWLGKNGKYYTTQQPNQHTGSRSGAFKAANRYKLAGRANIAATVVLGGISIHSGYQQDGGQFGINSQRATAATAGGIVGGWAGAEAGAAIGAGIGVWFGGVGAIPGAVIGGFIGGVAGSFAGSSIGEGSVNYYHKP